MHTHSVYTVKLTAWDSTQSRFREGVYTFAYDGREVAVATQTLQGVPLSDAGVLANLTTGLETLFGRGNVEVSGSRSAGFSATFVGQWAGRAVPIATDSTPGLSMVPPIDPASTLAARDQSNVTAQATQASVTNTYDLLINVAAGELRIFNQSTSQNTGNGWMICVRSRWIRKWPRPQARRRVGVMRTSN